MSYWLATVAILVVGLLTSLRPFLLLLGLAMLLLGPFRRRALVFWPAMAGVLAFLAGYVAVAPWTCEAHSAVGGASSTVCSSLIGIRYAGGATYNPSLLPGVYAGLVLAPLVAALMAGLILLRRRHRTYEEL